MIKEEKNKVLYNEDLDAVAVAEMLLEKKPLVSVLPTMIKTFGVEFFTGTLMKIVYDALMFVSPQILK